MCVCVCVCVYAGVHQGMVLVDAEADDFKRLVLPIRGLHGSKNSYPNPKRPVNRVQTTGELGGVRLPLIIHGLPWKRDLWNLAGSQKILTMFYFDVQFQFCVMWSSWFHFNKDYSLSIKTTHAFLVMNIKVWGALRCKFHSCLVHVNSKILRKIKCTAGGCWSAREVLEIHSAFWF